MENKDGLTAVKCMHKHPIQSKYISYPQNPSSTIFTNDNCNLTYNKTFRELSCRETVLFLCKTLARVTSIFSFSNAVFKTLHS